MNQAALDTNLDVLARLSPIIRLGSRTSDESLHEIKLAKYHFVDTGKTCALRLFKYRSFDAGQPNATALGGLLDSLVPGELTRVQPIQGQKRHTYHWRNSDGMEINIFAESPHKIVCFEVKASTSVSGLDFLHLKRLSTEGPGKNRKFNGKVLNLAQHDRSYEDNCFAIPIRSLWALIELKGSANASHNLLIPFHCLESFAFQVNGLTDRNGDVFHTDRGRFQIC
ncbi:MAG: DUF4143 domain-containing protein [Albidovulum sp.]|nr:DUF4143 domain-containing protein [Albidovulum sp.]